MRNAGLEEAQAGIKIAGRNKLVLEKAEEPEIKLQISAGSLKYQDNSRKNLLLLY